MWSNAASTSPPLLVLFIVEFFLVGDSKPPKPAGGVAFRVSIGARGAVVDDLRLLVPLDSLIDLVTDVLLSPAFEAERGLVSVLDFPEEEIELLPPPPLAELLAWEIFLSLVSVALAPGLIFLGSNSPLLTRRIDLRADTFSASVAARELFRPVPLPASKCAADLDFIECLPAFVWCSDDSAARLGLGPCGGVL